MFEDDLFKFIPADSGIYENALLVEPEQEPKQSKNFFGIIKTGDKCVPHSKSNPKQRRKIENISKESEGDGYVLPATADRILWSDETFNVLQLSKMSLEESSTVIKVASNGSEFSCVELAFGQNLLVLKSGAEQRVLAHDLTSSRQLDMPRDLDCHVVWNDRHLKITEVLNESSFPIKIKVIHCGSQVDDFSGHAVLLQEENSSKFLVCSSVHAGWVDQSGLIVIPEAMKTTFKIGRGLRGSKEDEWDDFVGMLKRSVRHQLDHDITGYPEIIVRDEVNISPAATSSFLTESKVELPCYENVEINLFESMKTLRPKTIAVYENIGREEVKAKEDVSNDGNSHQVTSAAFTADVFHSTHSPINQSTETSEPNFQQRGKINEIRNETPFEEKNAKPQFIRLRAPAESKKVLIQASPKPRPSLSSDQKTLIDSSSIPQSGDQYAFPDQLEGLSCSEIKKCLRALGLGEYCKEDFNINGRTLSNMDAKDLERILEMSPFEANKLSRFIRGWRP